MRAVGVGPHGECFGVEGEGGVVCCARTMHAHGAAQVDLFAARRDFGMFADACFAVLVVHAQMRLFGAG